MEVDDQYAGRESRPVARVIVTTGKNDGVWRFDYAVVTFAENKFPFAGEKPKCSKQRNKNKFFRFLIHHRMWI